MRAIPLLIPLLMLAAPAPAQDKQKEKAPDPLTMPTRPTISATPVAIMIAGFDRDADARVTRAEFDAGVEHSFKAGDANGDGAISLIELSNWAATWLGNAGALPGQYDFDREGEDDRISADEYRAEFGRRWDSLDKDRDGVLTRAELIVLTMPRPAMPERDGKRGRRPR